MNNYPRHRLGSVEVGESLPIEEHIGNLKNQLRELMGKDDFTAFYVGNHTWNNEVMEKRMIAKLEELQPNSLFRNILEDRRDKLVSAYATSDNQEEIALELAEISISLERD